MQSKKAVIIGSGIAGLAASIRLVSQGYEVDVYEKSDKPGGKLGHFSEAGYQFDTGPSLFTQPHQLEALLALVGEKLSDYFTYQKMPVSCNQEVSLIRILEDLLSLLIRLLLQQRTLLIVYDRVRPHAQL